MARYHINGEGNAGVCRARPGGCPFGDDADHYSSKGQARDIFEAQQELLADVGIGGTPPLSAAAEVALSASLQPLPQQPRWIEDYSFRLQQELFGVTPEVIATVDSPMGPLAVVWEAATVESNDIVSEVEDGYRISRISLRTMADGEIVGRVKANQMTAESLAESYGTDEWRGFRYLAANESFYAMDRDYPDHRDYSPDQSADEFARTTIEPPAFETQRELVEFIDQAQRHLQSYSDGPPKSMDPETLRSELSRLQNLAAQQLDRFSEGFRDPSIDYIKLDREELRGRGFGAALYIFMARKQAESGHRLRASGLQTVEAQRSWRRMAAEPRLPIRVGNCVYEKRGARSISTHYFLDFR